MTDEDDRTTPIGLFNYPDSYWRSAVALEGAEDRGQSHIQANLDSPEQRGLAGVVFADNAAKVIIDLDVQLSG